MKHAIGAATGIVTVLMTCIAMGEPSEAPKIGVVRLQAVLDQLKEKLDIDVRLEARAQKAGEEIETLKAQLQELENQLAYLTAGSEQRAHKEQELKDKQRDFQAHYKVQVKALQTEKLRATQTLYEKILGEVERYGKDNGYDLILRGSESTTREIDDPMELNLRIVERMVLYAPAEQDISAEIAARLNARYEQEKTSAAAEPHQP